MERTRSAETSREAWSIDGRMIWITVEDDKVVITVTENADDVEFSLDLNSGHVEQLVNGLISAVGREAGVAIIDGIVRRRERR